MQAALVHAVCDDWHQTGLVLHLQCESKKSPWHFSQTVGNFTLNFKSIMTHLLYVTIYAGLQIFIQLSPTMTKLCHISLSAITQTSLCKTCTTVAAVAALISILFCSQWVMVHGPVRRHWLQTKTNCYWGLQQLCKSCRTCFKFYCMFYFTCVRSFKRRDGIPANVHPSQY